MADPVSIEAAQQASTVAVSLNLISKSFGATLALDNVSFDIQAGSVHALLGENGAGKSTLVKLLSGLIEPDRGTIQLLGQSVRLPQPRRQIVIRAQTHHSAALWPIKKRPPSEPAHSMHRAPKTWI